MVEDTLMTQWQALATDYPTKALLVALQLLDQEQQERLQILHGQMDGQMWSPSAWTVEEA